MNVGVVIGTWAGARAKNTFRSAPASPPAVPPPPQKARRKRPTTTGTPTLVFPGENQPAIGPDPTPAPPPSCPAVTAPVRSVEIVI